jgi:acetate kinase
VSERPVLVLNAGSSSLKYQLVVPETAQVQAKGIVERIGEPGSPVADHGAAMRTMAKDLAASGIDLDAVGLRAVGHRVVHGGPDFTDPTIIDDKVIEEIKDLIPLAPLHNPGAVSGIEWFTVDRISRIRPPSMTR